MTPEEGAKALALLDERLRFRVVQNALRRSLSRGATNGRRLVRQSGLGAALWRTRNNKRKGISGTPPIIVKSSRLQVIYRGYVGAIEAEGMAGLIETGGSTQPHKITARRASTLRFQMRSGRWFNGKEVHHPGGKVAKRPFLERAAREAISLAPDEILKGALEAAREAGF